MTKQLTTVLSFALTTLLSISTLAAAMYTTYQAKIIKPDGMPLESTNVNFRFTILDPLGGCILYTENFNTINMAGTGGLVYFSLGSGIKTFPTSGTVNFSDVFNNQGGALSCATGGPPSYSPGANDLRKIVMQFHDGNGWQTLPAMSINHVPYAMYAKNAVSATTAVNSIQLNGKTDLDFVQVTSIPTCSASQALQFNGASFSCVAVGSSGGGGTIASVSASAPIAISGSASAPVISISVASMSSDGYLTAADYAEFKTKLSASSTQIVNTLGYAPVSSSAVAAQIASAATSSNIADTIVKRDSSGNFTANDIYSNATKVNYVDIYKPSSSFNIRLQAPTSLSTNYVLNLPTTSGTTGQVLSTDGAGNLSWISAATGSVTSVSGTAGEITSSGGSTPALGLADVGTAGTYYKVITDSKGRVTSGVTTLTLSDLPSGTITSLSVTGPISSTGAANPTLSIAQANATTNGYLSSADWATFNNKQNATSAAIIATLGYTPANATSATQWITNASDIYYNTGYVGVGTATPSAAVDVVQSGTSSYTGLKSNISSTTGNATGVDTYASGSNYSTGVLVEAQSNGAAVGVDIYAAVNSASGSYVRGINVGIDDSLVAGSGLRLFADTATTKASKAIEISSGFNSGYAIYANTNGMSYFKGSVGVGVTTPVTKLDVSGAIRISMDGATCASSYAGALRYNAGNVEFCNGTTWSAFGGSVTSSSVISALGYTPANSATVVSSQWSTSGSTISYAAGNVGVGVLCDETFTNCKDLSNGLTSLMGIDNLSFATGAGASLTAGSNYNILMGTNAGSALTTGDENIIIGREAGKANANGSANLFIGSYAGVGNTGDENTFVGAYSGGGTMGNPGTGYSNAIFGAYAGGNLTDGYQNTMIGYRAGRMTTTGFRNYFGGYESGEATTEGYYNVFIGYSAGLKNTTANNSVALGASALTWFVAPAYSDAYNTAIGAEALTGVALQSTGVRNTALGGKAGDGITTGSDNILIGYNTDTPNATTNNFINIGNTILGNSLSGKVGIGVSVPTAVLHLKAGTSTANTAPLKFTSGTLTTAPEAGAVEYDGNTLYYTNNVNGRRALATVSDVTAVSGTYVAKAGDTMTGTLNLPSNGLKVGTSQLTVSGTNVGIGTTTPSVPLEVSGRSQFSTSLANVFTVTGKGSTYADSVSGIAVFYSEVTTAAGGNVIKAGSAYAPDTFVVKDSGNIGIGTTTPATALDVVGDIQYTGTITDVSDRRLKTNIAPLDSALSTIRKIKTYSYVMKDDPKVRTEYGVMAQDMLGIIPNLVKNIDARGEYFGVNYMGLIPWSIRALQEVDSETQNLRRENSEIKRELASLKEKNEALEQKIEKILQALEQRKHHGEKK